MHQFLDNTGTVLKGINSVGEGYFIRLKDKPGYFVKFKGINGQGDNIYAIEQGEVGSAVWKEKAGKDFIKQSGAKNLELISIENIIGKDGTKN